MTARGSHPCVTPDSFLSVTAAGSAAVALSGCGTPASAESAEPEFLRRHLTWGRVVPEPPTWAVASIVQDLIVVAAAWGESLEEREPGLAKQMRIRIEALRGGHRTHVASPSAH